MLRAQPPNMLQTMSNSQEIALISIFLEDLVLTRAQVLFSPYVLTIQGRSSLCPYSTEQRHSAANLTNMLQTMPNSQETILTWGLKVL